ncbi:unnamed protein product [Victoria cruziana]
MENDRDNLGVLIRTLNDRFLFHGGETPAKWNRNPDRPLRRNQPAFTSVASSPSACCGCRTKKGGGCRFRAGD